MPQTENLKAKGSQSDNIMIILYLAVGADTCKHRTCVPTVSTFYHVRRPKTQEPERGTHRESVYYFTEKEKRRHRTGAEIILTEKRKNRYILPETLALSIDKTN